MKGKISKTNLTSYIFRATILYSQRTNTNFCGNIVFRQFCVTIKINSNVKEHLLERLSAKVGRLKCEVTDPDGLVYRNITVLLEAPKGLFHGS